MVAVLLLAAMVPVGTASEAQVDARAEVRPEVRGNILIQGDGEFTPDNGVRSGSGSVDDPYIISDWLITPDRSAAVFLKDTRAHVLIENITLVDDAFSTGFDLVNATNVTVRNARVFEATFGIRASASENVLVENVVMGVEAPPTAIFLGPRFFGIDLDGGNNLQFQNMTIKNFYRPLFWTGPENVTVQDSTFQSLEGIFDPTIYVAVEGVNLTFQRNLFEDVYVHLEDSDDVFFIENVHRGARYGIEVDENEKPVGFISVCGSTFRDIWDRGISHTQASGAVFDIGGSIFQNGSIGVFIDGEKTSISNSSFSNMEAVGVWLRPPNGAAILRNNSFTGNNVGSILANDNQDARWNWWGDLSGPSGDGPGTGDELYFDGSNGKMSPWLTAPPELNFDCAPGDTVGDQHEQKVHASVDLDATASVNVNEHAGPAHIHTSVATEARWSSGPVPVPV